MIEFCSRKRMAISILIMICLSFVMLLIENQWSSRLRNMKIKKKIGSTNGTCKSKTMEILEECRECSITDMDKSYCKQTGYRRLSKCDDTKVYTSCNIEPVTSKNFWIFEACMAISAIGSYAIVRWQQQTLNKQLMDKINTQVAAGI